jgi:energy-coupling factor transport system permease protein
MNNVLAGRYIPINSVIHKLDARIKLICFVLILAAIVSTLSAWGYLAIACAAAALIMLSKISARTALEPIRRLWLFFIVIFLMNALFYGTGEPLWSWAFISVSIEGIVQGTRVAFNVIAITVLGNVLICATAPIDLTHALSALLKPLKVIRVPVDDVAMIISVAIQFIPVLTEEAGMIKKAQTARGVRFESKKLREKAASFLALIIPMFLCAFRRADELSIAMEARGYRSAGRRTRKARKPLSGMDFIALAVSVIFCAALIFFRIWRSA